MTFYFKTVKLLEMEKVLNNKMVESFVAALSVVVIFCFISILWVNSQDKNPTIIEQSKPILSKYHGKIYNIFFHSLIVYPELAFNGNINSDLYKKNMIIRDRFEKMLSEFYNNNFVLIDVDSIYNVDKNGAVSPKDIYLPTNKKPLIISIDDLSYYKSMKGHGFADKLVIDENGDVATEIVTPDGKNEVTRNGDVVPILDDFIKVHPDFSLNGTKGIIALTGYEGVLGYRTEATTSPDYISEIQSAKNVIERLKATGWRFASHSYSHNSTFSTGVTSLEDLENDTELWDKEVRPLVGNTNIFVGPYGQIFTHDDPRRSYLISKGFKIFYGVGIDLYSRFYPDSLEMDRADIDGYRLSNNPDFLNNLLSGRAPVI